MKETFETTNRQTLSLPYFCLYCILFGGIAFSLWLYGNPFQIGMTNDSRNYVFAAEHLPDAWIKSDGTFYAEWAPLLSIVLFFWGTSQMNVWLLEGLLLFLNISWMYFWLWKNINQREIQLLGIGIVSLFSPLFLIHAFLWSESLYLLFLGLWLLGTSNTLNQTIYTRIWIQLTVFCRYMGIPYVFGYGITEGLLIQKRTLKAYMRWTVTYLLTALPIVMYLIWVRVRSNEAFTGDENLYSRSMYEQLMLTLDKLSSIFFPSILPGEIRILLFIIVAFVVVLILKFRWNTFAIEEKKHWGALIFLLIFYVMSRPSMAEDIERQLAPYLIVLLLLSMKAMEGVNMQSKKIKHTGILLLVYLLLFFGMRSFKVNAFWHNARTNAINRQSEQKHPNNKVQDIFFLDPFVHSEKIGKKNSL